VVILTIKKNVVGYTSTLENGLQFSGNAYDLCFLLRSKKQEAISWRMRNIGEC